MTASLELGQPLLTSIIADASRGRHDMSVHFFEHHSGCCRVGKQIVNVPSFIVRVDSQKHIDFALNSPFGGGRPGRVKRKNANK